MGANKGEQLFHLDYHFEMKIYLNTLTSLKNLFQKVVLTNNKNAK